MQNSKQPSSTIVPGIWTAEQFEFGFIKHLPPVKCPVCAGRGRIFMGMFDRASDIACHRCAGTGWVDGRRP
jgi:DnaJ-class molecular chaperone